MNRNINIGHLLVWEGTIVLINMLHQMCILWNKNFT